MPDNFSAAEEKNSQVERELLSLKEEYHRPKMSQAQLEKLHMTIERAKITEKKEREKASMRRVTIAAAILAGILIILPNTSASVAHAMEQIPIIGSLVKVVTFRNYKYESDRNNADINVPEIAVEEGAVNSEVGDKLNRTTEEINAEIRDITDKLVKEFESNLKEDAGYQDVIVKSEVLVTTKDYFTLKLICYQGAGSGYEWNYYYTIDLNTGERLQLKDIFREDADYITPISENIKEQMRTRMQEDEMVYYWLEDEIEEWNFKSITEETSFYLNADNHVVISFNEGDVAPMYMGVVEFEIPQEVLSGIRK